jgi:phosphohistidine phosphatase
LKKKLYLIRHAKSSWKNISLDDFDRPLNKRGKNDAPIIGKLLKERINHIDLIITSPAKRTAETARIIGKNMDYTKMILYDEKIYEASANDLLQIIRELDDKISNVLLVGHNPGLTDLVNYLSNEIISNIPTCGVVAIEFKNTWMDIKVKDGKITFFEYPKKYLGLQL